MWLPAVKVSQTMHINVIMSKVVRSAEQRLTKLSSMHVYCSNDCLMIFLSTAQSQYSFQCFMICVHHSWVSHSPVVCHNGGQSLTPACHAFTPRTHGHNSLISSLIQSVFTDWVDSGAADPASHPLICMTAASTIRASLLKSPWSDLWFPLIVSYHYSTQHFQVCPCD